MNSIKLTTAGARLEAELSALVEQLRRSVAIVRDGGRDAGSGVIWQADGVIVTNHHVVPGAEAEVTLYDGRTLRACTRLSDHRRDLAVLDVPAQGLPAATIGDSSRLRLGELVFAVGNPQGLPWTVTAGIVSGLADSGRQDEQPIQADVSLAPGNSGGLLATATGCVVGINAMVRLPGLALAVPSNAVTALLQSGPGGRAYLGVTLLPVRLPPTWQSRLSRAGGLLLAEVIASGPAEAAGLLPGDIVLSLNDAWLSDAEELALALGRLQPGDTVELGLLRAGQPRRVRFQSGQALAVAA